MPLLHELGTAARERRKEIGLSQQAVAELAGLSRATISDLENGTIRDLSSTRVERVANELGFSIGVMGTRSRKEGGALQTAARVASVPYASEVPAPVIENSFLNATVPPGYIPHLRTLLQEAPVAILADVVDQLQREHDVPRHETWKRMRLLAQVLKCDRALWQQAST